MSDNPTKPKAESEMKTGIELIVAERQRQLEREGWTPEHDDDHILGEMAAAAICYAFLALDPEVQEVNAPPVDWPWDSSWWKPSHDNIRNLEKAGALIAAEIDRLQRAKLESYNGPQPTITETYRG